MTSSPPRRGLLCAAGLVSNFDRFSIAPMLVLIGAALHVPLGTAAAAASAYTLGYGLAQPAWGMASDRFGRVRVMRLSLAAASLGALSSAVAPGAVSLVVARGLTGACFAAAIAGSLTYVGDTVAPAERHRALGSLMSAFALGTALATVVAGALAHWVSWRLVFALPGLIAACLALALRRLPEPALAPREGGALRTAVRSRWQWYVMGVALLEGGVLLGCFTYLPPALESLGAAPGTAGAVAALYGVAAMGGAQLVRRTARHLGPVALIVLGGTQVTLAYGVAAVHPSLVTLGLGAVLLGGGWAFLHSTVQAWATLLVPQARASGIALFGVALYLGSALGTELASGPAQQGGFQALFGAAAALAIPLTAAAAYGRRRYGRDRDGGGGGDGGMPGSAPAAPRALSADGPQAVRPPCGRPPA
ncbi:MFS transporter [Streptomyces sp. NBC_00083]|uniref:MFS transporter n=1 Tax=Streptomyces sp. NBC_00083 TaxID=2975647 RepID=UPI002254EA6A|nr:MFS transporter [Streptomyces sp. NBC_00083]MCX5386415.1 MFS transporter [Streptomyces sp. NBC_00083]